MFKTFIWGGISPDVPSVIKFYGGGQTNSHYEYVSRELFSCVNLIRLFSVVMHCIS